MPTKPPENKYLEIVIALLPLLGEANGLYHSFLLGLIVVSTFWITKLFFSFLKNLFPKNLFAVAVFLWILTNVQISYYLMDLNPLWGLSLFLLLRMDIEKEEFWIHVSSEPFFSSLISSLFSGGLFWAALVVLGWLREENSRHFGIFIFETPAVAFFIMGTLFFLFSNKESA